MLSAVACAIAPAQITLAFAPAPPLAAAVTRAAVAEAAAIWQPYGVAVTGADLIACPARTDGLVLTVVMSSATAPPADRQAPLGAVDFDADGAPAHVMTVFVDRILRMLEGAHLWSVPASQWPRVIREQAVGCAIGRVIAHEIGHVLLRSRRHTARGLMRAVQPAGRADRSGPHPVSATALIASARSQRRGRRRSPG